jgi:hypothetical protein
MSLPLKTQILAVPANAVAAVANGDGLYSAFVTIFCYRPASEIYPDVYVINDDCPEDSKVAEHRSEFHKETKAGFIWVANGCAIHFYSKHDGS